MLRFCLCKCTLYTSNCLMHVNIFQSKEEKYFIHNHLSFRVMYHKDADTDTARIVGFEVSAGRCVAFLIRPAVTDIT